MDLVKTCTWLCRTMSIVVPRVTAAQQCLNFLKGAHIAGGAAQLHDRQETGRIRVLTVLLSLQGITGMKESGATTRCKGKAPFTLRLELPTQVNGMQISTTARAGTCGRMAAATKAILQIRRFMDKALCTMARVGDGQVSLSMAQGLG